MADETSDKTWIADLESALSEECRSDSLYQGLTIPESLRAEVWKSCLGAHSPLPICEEIFDLPEQKILRQDCQQFVAKLGNDEDEKLSVQCDLESVLTWWRKSGGGGEYKKCWLELLAPLVALRLPRGETASLFREVSTRYIPRCQAIYPLLRLLVLYHDPKLCSFLDTKRVTPEVYASSWFQTLFASTCSLPVVTAMWDLYFQQGDPFFLLFLALIMIINSSEQIMNMKDEIKERIIELLSSLPCALQLEDVQDFCSLAQYYANRTPSSFRQDLEGFLFEDEESASGGSGGGLDGGWDVEQALVIPVSVRELLESSALSLGEEDSFRFFLIDCRPADQYNSGHLPTAFHLDCNLMLQGGEVFNTAVQALLSSKRQAIAANSSAGGEHLCFMGCGSLQSDQYTHMVVASFLHSNTHYVSLLTGGYKALHDYFGESIDSMLIDHNNLACLVCIENKASQGPQQKNGTHSPSKDFLGKIGAAMKLKSAEVKEKLLEYIVNPGGVNDPTSVRHVSPNDKLGRRYRNTAPVFSIDDDHDVHDGEWEQQEMEESQFEIVSLSSWMKRPDIVASFECKEIKMNGEKYDSILLVSPTHVFVLRRSRGSDKGKVVVRRHLSAIARITCKKRFPEMITFKYGAPGGDLSVISDMDTFMIPKAKEATQLISKRIVRLYERKEEEGEEEEGGDAGSEGTGEAQ